MMMMMMMIKITITANPIKSATTMLRSKAKKKLAIFFFR
uniref:Alternative protein n=1 Tax=Syphacia muris TaxID=451379 RepID=A0A0N5AVT2_9BILA